MISENIKKTMEYMKQHPVDGFNLVAASEANTAGNNVRDKFAQAFLVYRKEGYDAEEKNVLVFIGEKDGLLRYRTVFPVYRPTKRKFVEGAYLLVANMLDVSDGGFRMHVTDQNVMGIDSYIVDFESINNEKLDSNEHKMISTILWANLAIHYLGQLC